VGDGDEAREGGASAAVQRWIDAQNVRVHGVPIHVGSHFQNSRRWAGAIVVAGSDGSR
jgi:hypothetical protein